MSCPIPGSAGVIPVESPTVAKAEMASNATLSKAKSLTMSSPMVPIATTPTASSTTVNAWRSESRGIRRLPTVTSCSPRISLQMTKASRTNVPTLIPPAVPALPPPMNIRPSLRARVSWVALP
ncbi:MAG: hypothetical protein BWY91_02896 [bacterium ADurb.BinA028]|nr:MAG: hypothetical protein BWY91_02896 [bacterium ADurb.BinA028]